MLRKIEDIVIHREEGFYCTFPAAVALPDGRLIAAFRRAPDHRFLPFAPNEFNTHGDPLSQLWMVESPDNGQTWRRPRLLYAPAEGGSQDAGLFYDGGRYLYANSFIWKLAPDFLTAGLRKTGRDGFLYPCPLGHLTPAGSYVMRSADLGLTWEGPFLLESIPGGPETFPGFPLRPFNRANIVRLRDGSLMIAQQVINKVCQPGYLSAVAVYRSEDDGLNWRYYSPVTSPDRPGVYEEPFLYLTPSGRVVVLLRVHEQPGERAVLWTAASTDEGRTWTPLYRTGLHAEPSCAWRMADGRAILGYGYRNPPCGVRLRVCEPELERPEQEPEFIVRDDAEWGDTGYPWITGLGGNRFLIVYYFNKKSTRGPAHIAGTVFEIT